MNRPDQRLNYDADNHSIGRVTMDDIRTFVDTVIEYYKSHMRDLEEDQNLPSAEVLERVCHVLLNVSTMPEELRYPSFRVCFVRPDSDLIDVYLYAHTILFETPIDFNAKELHKLAPALNANMSYLMIDTSTDDYKIIGINASYTIWENILLKESSTGNRMPRIPNIYLKGPGTMDACIGEARLVSYNSGTCCFSRTDTFTSTAIADELRSGSDITEEDRLKILYRILWRGREYKHGGALFIVPSEEACKGFLKIKYRIPSEFAFGSIKKLSYYPHAVAEKAVITYADLLAKFTAVDGAVILDKNLGLLGFGAESIIPDFEHNIPKIRFIGHDNQEQSTRRFNDYGMRHRVCYRFCYYVDGCIAIIISQDGSVECCTKKDGQVMVYDNVAIPLL